MFLQQTLNSAIQYHQAGRLSEAEAIYRQILAQNPNNADALHLLGVVAHQAGQNDVAANLIRQAITIRPNFPDAANNLGNVLREIGQLDEAVTAFSRAIALKPNYPQAYNNLGNIMKYKGRLEDAIAAYRQAVALEPNYADAYYNLGNALKDVGQLDEAIAAYSRAIALQLHSPEIYNNLGNALMNKGQVDQAIAAYLKGIALRPNYPEAHNNLGNALSEKKDVEKAIAAYRQAIALKPDYPEAHCNLGKALKDQGQLDQAITAFQKAIELKPDLTGAHTNLGIALRSKGQFDAAVTAHRKAIALKPDDPEILLCLGNALMENGDLDEAINAYRQIIALNPNLPPPHYNLGLALLLRGEYTEGWLEYEWRWKDESLGLIRRSFQTPQWDGSELSGRQILLYAEKGFGDTIQFVRFVNLVAQRGGKVILECAPELFSLFEQMPAVEQCVKRGQSLPHFDAHCPLHSLPLAFHTTLENIPADVPYLRAESAAVRTWHERLAALPGLKVGLRWAGHNRPGLHRTIPLEAFSPLAQIPGISFCSLQTEKTPGRAQLKLPGFTLSHWESQIEDFADTAALIANLDLIISIDTATAHLAGAMGKRAWVLLPTNSDWRWMRQGSQTPWYPTLRLFRQTQSRMWNDVMQQISQALAKLVPVKS